MGDPTQRFRLDRIPDNLLREPLDFLVAEHVRLRKVCEGLDLLATRAESETARHLAPAITAFLSDVLPQHLDDEDIELFPRLRSACSSGDDISGLIDELAQDHIAVRVRAAEIVTDLKGAASRAGKMDTAAFRRHVRAFNAAEQRHLDLEDRVLISFARRRLSVSDLDRIGRAIAARHGLVYPD